MEASNEIVGSIFLVLFSSFYLCILCFGILLTIASIWLFIACLIDVTRKSEAEFKDKTLWIVLLTVSFVFGFGLITGLVYYFVYKPRLKFWEN